MDEINLLSCRNELEGEAYQNSRGHWWLKESECQRKFWRKSGVDTCIVGSKPGRLKSWLIVHLHCRIRTQNINPLCIKISESLYMFVENLYDGSMSL